MHRIPATIQAFILTALRLSPTARKSTVSFIRTPGFFTYVEETGWSISGAGMRSQAIPLQVPLDRTEPAYKSAMTQYQHLFTLQITHSYFHTRVQPGLGIRPTEIEQRGKLNFLIAFKCRFVYWKHYNVNRGATGETTDIRQENGSMAFPGPEEARLSNGEIARVHTSKNRLGNDDRTDQRSGN